ncbi:hypothetical protein DFJ58DRAFT_731647 [Suillus subalutaceus]|uniref:uncharacterized protein n=1 Tax=Suillus subalutaceus TaxID=48586 RepID=UPI001B86D09A|nr:uncharacterized protein DFJ58DRAFT_731647 [Suillus subalutaceus]KAG1843355.1 hypothetical protein DFJ58DRAFT_731647 [Suillus subalutaceus]
MVSVCLYSGILKIKEPKIKEVTQSAVQTTIEKINNRLLKVSLGYAMMDVMSKNNFGKGPKMIAQTINIRGINESFLKEFGLQVQYQGLHNRDIHNAIIIGINPRYVKLSSLEPMKPRNYTNVVEWSSIVQKNKSADMLLYNGNHCRTYM